MIRIKLLKKMSESLEKKKESGVLNNKTREWINISSTISRYLPTVEHQLT